MEVLIGGVKYTVTQKPFSDLLDSTLNIENIGKIKGRRWPESDVEWISPTRIVSVFEYPTHYEFEIESNILKYGVNLNRKSVGNVYHNGRIKNVYPLTFIPINLSAVEETYYICSAHYRTPTEFIKTIHKYVSEKIDTLPF